MSNLEVTNKLVPLEISLSASSDNTFDESSARLLYYSVNFENVLEMRVDAIFAIQFIYQLLSAIPQIKTLSEFLQKLLQALLIFNFQLGYILPVVEHLLA